MVPMSFLSFSRVSWIGLITIFLLVGIVLFTGLHQNGQTFAASVPTQHYRITMRMLLMNGSEINAEEHVDTEVINTAENSRSTFLTENQLRNIDIVVMGAGRVQNDRSEAATMEPDGIFRNRQDPIITDQNPQPGDPADGGRRLLVGIDDGYYHNGYFQYDNGRGGTDTIVRAVDPCGSGSTRFSQALIPQNQYDNVRVQAGHFKDAVTKVQELALAWRSLWRQLFLGSSLIGIAIAVATAVAIAAVFGGITLATAAFIGLGVGTVIHTLTGANRIFTALRGLVNAQAALIQDYNTLVTALGEPDRRITWNTQYSAVSNADRFTQFAVSQEL